MTRRIAVVVLILLPTFIALATSTGAGATAPLGPSTANGSCAITAIAGSPYTGTGDDIAETTNESWTMTCVQIPVNSTRYAALEYTNEWYSLHFGPSAGSSCTGTSPSYYSASGITWTAGWTSTQANAAAVTGTCYNASGTAVGTILIQATGPDYIDAFYQGTDNYPATSAGAYGYLQATQTPSPGPIIDTLVTGPNGLFGGQTLGCNLVDVQGDLSVIGQTYTSAESTADQTYGYTVDFSGSADSIALVDNSVTSGTSQVIWGKTFYTTGAAFDLGDGAGTLTSPDSFSYAPAVGDAIDPDLWCHTGGSATSATWVNWGTIESLGITGVPSGGGSSPGNGPFNLGTCFASASWDLFNPVTWVTGALHDGLCIIEWLFEPSLCNGTAAISSCINYSGFVSDIETRVPTAYVAQTVTAITTLYTGVQGQLSTGACDTPTIAPWTGRTGTLAALSSLDFQIPGPSTDGCTMPGATDVGDMSTWINFLIDFMTFGVWMAAAAILWRMMPWHRPGDGIEIIEQFGGLSDHYMENGVEVYQTNEGSD